MSRSIDLLLSDIRLSLAEMGEGGGRVSASTYDTAQVIRYGSQFDALSPAFAWLLARQGDDGGWGDPAVPLGRDVPTLAAVLSLNSRGIAPQAQARGLAFLRTHAERWAPPLPEDIPIGVELILPRLLEEAQAAGLDTPVEPYAAVVAMGLRRRALIEKFQPAAGTSAVHSWEAWGTEPDAALLDQADSLGHSPAATAAWIRKAAGRSALADTASRAQRYLERAAAATGEGIPGVVPTVFPIDRFEKLWAPYALLLTGLLDHPALKSAVDALLDDIAEALQRRRGMGFSDSFDPDGDDTAAGLAVLLAAGRPADMAFLERFEEGEHFSTWPHEMNVSLSTTTRAVHALALAGRDVQKHRDFLAGRQLPDGRWVADKWHQSWLYTTCHAVAAMLSSDDATHQHAVDAAIAAVLAAQSPEGGWRDTTADLTATETAYALLTLLSCGAARQEQEAVQRALRGGYRWLSGHYQPFASDGVACWIGKEAYRPQRVDRSFEAIALAALALRFESDPR